MSTISAIEIPALARLGAFVAGARFEPTTTSRNFVRDALIDCIGCILLGAATPVARKTRRALSAGRQIGAGGAPIYGTRYLAAPAATALANAVAGHALEFDDWEIPGNTHVSVALLPAILAISHEQGLPGAAAFDAYVAGFEVIARVGEAINLEHYDRGWHASATLGALGAAAACARVLGLDAEMTTQALAIACSRALGFNAQFGSEAKALQVGFAVDGGVTAALMAAAGLGGQGHMLEHARGLAALMGPGDSRRIDVAMDKLGNGLAIDEYGIVFKPWPCCGYAQRTLTGMREAHERGLDPDAIERIELRLPSMHAEILSFRHPRTISEAQFSLPYCAAMLLLAGDLTSDDLHAQTWREPEVRRIIDRVRIHSFEPRRPELNYDPDEPDRILLKTPGTTHSFEVPYPLGAPQNPWPGNRLRAKFARNAGFDSTTVDALWPRLQAWIGHPDLHALLGELSA